MARTQLEIAIVGDSKDAERAFKRVSQSASRMDKDVDRSAGRFSRSMGAIGKAAKFAGPAVGLGLGGAMAFAVKNFGEGQKVAAQTEAVIKSTGKAARVTAGEVNKLAGAIARRTGLEDEAVQSGQNLLLTFKNIRNEQGKGNKIFDQSTRIMADLSVAMDQDMKTSAIQLGKALNDPVKGLTSLQRVGITFTESQRKQIKALQESGDMMGAQKIILRELESQFGGSARAFGETMPGAMARAKNAVGDFSELVGARLAPHLTSAAEAAARFVNQMEDGTGAGGRFVVKAREVATAIGAVAGRAVEIAKVGLAFARSEAGVTVLSAALGGLAGRFAGLALASVVGTVGRLAAGLRTAGGAMAAFNVAVSKNPIGLAATVIGTAVGALVGFSNATRQARTSSDELTSAINRQKDATRALADLDLEAAQRKANVKTANAALAAAEKELADARRSGDPTRLRQAEASLEQARVSAERATRDYNRTEKDAKRVKDESREATRDLTTAARGRISTLKTEIAEIKAQIAQAQLQGKSDAEIATLKKRLADRTADYARELKSIPKNVRSSVSVKFNLSGIGDFAKDAAKAFEDGLDASGDGPGHSIRDVFNRAVGHGTDRAVGAVKKAQGGLGDGLGRIRPGSASSSLQGANSALRPLAGVGINNGLRVSSGKFGREHKKTSSGNVSFHSTGEAVDLAGPPAGMMRTFRILKSRYGKRLAELIYTPGGVGVKNGRPHRYTGRVAAQHHDHVHVALDLGAPGPGVGDGPGRLGVGSLKGLAKSVGLSDGAATIAAAVAMGESGGNPRARNNNPPIEDSQGLWQINTLAHPWAKNLFSPRANARAMKRISGGGKNWRPWSVFTNGAYRRYLGAASKLKGSFKGGGSGGSGGSSGGSGGAPAAPSGSPSQRAFNMGMARADVMEAQGNTGGANALRAATETARLQKVEAALRGKLTRTTRLRLMEEQAALLTAQKERKARHKFQGSASQKAFAFGSAEAGVLEARGDVSGARALRERIATERLAKVDKALGGKLTETTRLRLLEEQAALIASLADLKRESDEAAQAQAAAAEAAREAAEAARAAAFAQAEAQASAQTQYAQLTSGLGDDVAALQHELAVSFNSMHEAIRVYGVGSAEATNALVAHAQTNIQLNETMRQLSYEGVRSQMSAADVALIRAQVDTAGDTSDDLAALNESLKGATQGYQQAIAANDAQGVMEFGQAILGIKGSIDGLKQSVEENTSAMADLYKQQAEESRRREKLSQSQYGVLANAIAEVANGTLGGKVGLGFQSVGFAGSGVRY